MQVQGTRAACMKGRKRKSKSLENGEILKVRIDGTDLAS
jgi:hypothetical protein